MTRHRRNAVKVLLLAVAAVVVSTAPLWGLPTFLYVCGAIAAIASLVALWIFFDFFRGFRRALPRAWR
jgi:predicted ferric reductase